jgi:uncharacterized protein YndB with AHSA1/START domain
MPDILHEVTIAAAPDKVYEAITTQKGLAGWWGLTTADTAKPKLGFGDVFEFNGASSRTELRITNIIPNKKVEWECIKGPQFWDGTKVTFDLEKKDNSTIVHFAHKDLQVKADVFAIATNNWGRFMKSLKSLIETGKGDPLGSQDYHISITADITPKEALDKISRVSEWWATNFEGSSQKLNDVFTVRFGSGDMYKVKVTEFIPDKKFVWQVIDSHQGWVANETEWTGTKILWEVSAQKDDTQIDMTHIGLVPIIECYDKCTQGWDYLLQKSLLRFLTENKGLPA